MLDRLPPMWRHLALLVLSAALAWIASDVVPALNGRTGWAGAVGVVLTALCAVLTPLVRQYGVGRPDADDSAS